MRFKNTYFFANCQVSDCFSASPHKYISYHCQSWATDKSIIILHRCRILANRRDTFTAKNKKSMEKNFFNRYVWLIDTIQRHGNITFSDISDLWGVHRSTTARAPRTHLLQPSRGDSRHLQHRNPLRQDARLLSRQRRPPQLAADI